VVQLSIDEARPPSFHYQVGQRLAPLREEGILIVGSGNLVHNPCRRWRRKAEKAAGTEAIPPLNPAHMGHSALTGKSDRNRVHVRGIWEVRLTKARRTVPMLVVHRLCRILPLLAMASFAALALAQDAPDNPTPPDTTAPAPASTAATAPADPDLLAEVEQLRAEINALKRQLARLSSAVEQLQADRGEVQAPEAAPPKAAAKKRKTTAALTPPPASAPVEAEERTPTTILVFHDGHKVEAQNYAIVGQSLWIYTADESKKVPLADLDVTATKIANSDRGVTFQVPPTPPTK
jgi:hypothetical protein